MRIIYLPSVAVVALTVVASWPAGAKDDPVHPAYDFEPTTQAAAAADHHQAAATDTAPAGNEADARYPAAYFTPRVVVNDSGTTKK